MLSCDGRTEWLGNSRVISTIESVASWDEVGFFLSLYLKYQHPLLPLVHRPTFAQDVLHRRDRNDEAFRGLLLSIGRLFALIDSYELTFADLPPQSHTRKSIVLSFDLGYSKRTH